MGITIKSDEEWMSHALDLARYAKSIGEVPVGAIVVKDNKIIGEGWNQSIINHDPTAHAEIIALRKAAKFIGNYRLCNTTLYVTLEPCPMCAGAIIHSRIEHVIYSATDPKTGAAGSLLNLLNHDKLNHRALCTSGVMAEECGQLLTQFFKEKREARKKFNLK